VVDNASTDGSAEMVRDRHPSARLVELAENRGFAGGVAVGLAQASAPLVLLLNNDATVEPGALAALLAEAERHPRAGSFAAQMRFAEGGGVLNSAGLEIDRLGVVYDRQLGLPPERTDREPVEVFGASGGAVLLRRAMLDEVGGIDPAFFMYLEDADLAWRARARGWGAVYVPGAVVHHHHSVSSGHQSPLKYFYVGRNRVRLLARNMTTRQLVTALPAIVAYDVAYVAYAVARDRTLAPLRGRLAGLREWRTVRRDSSPRPVALAPVAGLRGALRRRRVWLSDSAGRSA
jgi:GT2 family glycosyltransferase